LIYYKAAAFTIFFLANGNEAEKPEAKNHMTDECQLCLLPLTSYFSLREKCMLVQVVFLSICRLSRHHYFVIRRHDSISVTTAFVVAAPLASLSSSNQP